MERLVIRLLFCKDNDAATRLDLAGTPKWRVRIAPDFDDWTVEHIRAG
jgi:hypothetical protein